MSNNERLFTREHEWIEMDEAGSATMGITHYAQNSLGDIIFLELPDVGRELTEGEAFGVVESVKSVSDLYAPCSGVVEKINDDAVNSPEIINSDAEGQFLVKVKKAILNREILMTKSEYEDFCK